MKKLIYCAAALAAALFAGSCQQEMLDTTATETTVTYTVALPDAQTKAIGDANTVDQLIYEVWKTVKPDERNLTDETKAIRLYQENTALVERNGKTCAVITLNLVQDQEYTILFWAQKKGTGVYNTDYLTDVHYAKSPKTELLSNHEEYAAFYATDFVSDSDPKSKTVILKRPFAQLNLATKNTADEYGVVVESSKVIVTKVGSHFNVATNIAETPGNPGFNSVTEPLEFVFNTESDPSGVDEYITVNGQKYEYVAMNYMFATGETVTVQYEINTILTGTNGQAATAQVTNQVLNVPLKENYRTNIVGNLLTSTTDYEVVIDASWDDQGDGTLVEVWDSKYAQAPYYNEAMGQYEISLASELAWLAHKVNGTLENPAAETKTVGYWPADDFSGKKVVLMEDIDLQNVLWTPIGATGSFKGIFDGNAKTIKNLNVKVTDKTPAGLFANAKYVQNLTVENAVVEGHYKVGVIVGDGLCSRIKDCHVKNATVTANTLNNDEGNNVGGIVGYLSAENEAYAIGCTVEEATIKGYRDVGGIAGTANSEATVSGNIVKNVTVIADQTPAYVAEKAANVGAFVGRDNDKKTIMENNEYVNVDVKVIGGSDNDLKAAIANATEGDTVYFAGTYGTFPAVGKAITVVCEEGTVFQGKSGLSLNPEAVVIGATFSNPSGTAVAGTITGTFKNCTFTGSNALRSCYAGETCYFEDCVFDGSTYGVHFDGGTDKNIYFKNCVLSGFNAFAAAINLVTFDGCTFKANGKSNYNGANLWGSAKFINTEFLFDGSVGNEWIDAIGTDKTYEFTGCNINGGSLFKADYIFSRSNGTKMNIDGVEYTYTDGYFVAGNNFIATTQSGLEKAMEAVQEGDVINVAAGDYDNFVAPAAKVTVICEKGTYFIAKNARNKLNIKGSTVEGAIFTLGWPTTDSEYVTVDQTINGIFKNCEFRGWNTLRYCYAGETCLFEDCDFKGGNYGVHFDGGANPVTFRRCKLSGFNAFGGAITELTFDNCEFYYATDGMWDNTTYNGVNLWGKTKLINTTFKFEGKTTNEWIGVNGAQNGDEITFTNCKVVNATGEEVSMLPYFSNITDGSKVTIDEVEYTLYENGSYKVNGKTYAAPENIQEVINNATENEVIQLAAGNYDETIAANSNITIEGTDGAVVACINLNGKDNVTLKNIEFDAAGAKLGYDYTGAAKQYANIITGDQANNKVKGSQNVVIDGCKFAGTFAKKGAAIAFTDYGRKSGFSGNITIKNCTFETVGANYEIYAHYTGNYLGGNGDFVIEKNTFKSPELVAGPIYLGRYASSTPVVLKDNTFENVTSLANAIYVQDHSDYGVSINATGNTFAE